MAAGFHTDMPQQKREKIEQTVTRERSRLLGFIRRRVSIDDRGSDVMEGWIRVSAGTLPETEVFIQTLKFVLATLQ